jgi:hypothetical protein
MRGIGAVLRKSVEELELYGDMLGEVLSSSESRLPIEVLRPWVVDPGLLDRRYCIAGRKGLGESVFLAENMDLYEPKVAHTSKWS